MVFRNKKIIAVGGGKGGVGKSFVVANLATALSQSEKIVTMVDTNVGSSNLHTFLGVPMPRRTLKDFIYDKYANLHSILLTNPHTEALLISGASEVMGLTTPNYNQKQRLFRGLKSLNCDLLFLDLPTGSNTEVVDVFMLSTTGLVILEPLSTTLESSFLFLKSLVFRIISRLFKKNKEILNFLESAFNHINKSNFETVEEILQELEKMDSENTYKARKDLEVFTVHAVLNNCHSKDDEVVVEPFIKLAKKYLSLEVNYLGKIQHDTNVLESIEKRTPLILQSPQSPASMDFKELAQKVLAC